MAGEGITGDRDFPSAEFAPHWLPPSLKFRYVGNNGRTDDSRCPNLRPLPQPNVIPSHTPHPTGFLRPTPNPPRSVIAPSRSALAANHRWASVTRGLTLEGPDVPGRLVKGIVGGAVGEGRADGIANRSRDTKNLP